MSSRTEDLPRDLLRQRSEMRVLLRQIGRDDIQVDGLAPRGGAPRLLVFSSRGKRFNYDVMGFDYTDNIEIARLAIRQLDRA